MISSQVRSIIHLIMNPSYTFTESFMQAIVAAGCAGNVLFFLYLRFAGYTESFGLRLIAFSIFVSYLVVLKHGVRGPVRKFYYEATLCLVVPFLFNYLFFLNTDLPFWGMSMPLCGFIYGFLSKFYILPAGNFIGWFMALTVIRHMHPDLNLELWSHHENFAMSFFASIVANILVMALENTYMRMAELKIEQSRLRETEENYIMLMETEKRLRESEEKFRLLIENASEGIFVIQDERVQYANPKSVEISGYTLEELLMKPFLQFLPADEHTAAITRHFRTLSSNSRNSKQVFRFLTKNGQIRWIEVDSVKVSWNNRPASISFFDDITERIESEQELKRYRHRLEDLVRERTRELEKAYQELMVAKDKAEAATRSKSEFLANMSHEIRTPMNAIVGVCDLIRNTALTVKQKEYLNIIRSSSRALLSLINDILDFSKIEAGKLEFEEVPFVLNEVIDEVSDMFRDKIQEKDLEFIIDIAANVPQRLISDPLRLKQVLVNLTSNAIKFTSNGEICISVTCESKTDDRAVLQFSVRDTGSGIPSHLLNQDGLEKLFESFFQADSSSSRRHGGSGLGLSITRNIVDMMNGNIHVASEPGKGSTFTVTAEFRYQTGEVSLRSMIPNALKSIRVLIVDDNPATLSVIKRFMDSFGFYADLAMSAEEAILKYDRSINESEPYHLIVMDVKMPDMDGITAAEKLKARGQQSPPIIFISASDYGNYVHRFGKESIENFLTKPIKQSVLFDTIMNAFGYRAEKMGQNIIYNAQTQNLAGAKILLVEDNPINQMVATEILTSADMVIHKAGNGQEAIEILKEMKFDAVLMDIQMPDMDGIEATGIIRNELHLNRLPIIAMTANAMSGDREKCISAGMNDYISKPIESRQIFSILSRWISLGPPSETGISTGIHPDRHQKDPVVSLSFHIELPDSLPGLDIQSGLNRINGNRYLYCSLLKEFLAENTDSMPRIRKALSHGNMEYAASLIHTIKGVSGNIGATRVFQSAKSLESGLQDGLLRENLLAKLENDLAEVMESARFVETVIASVGQVDTDQVSPSIPIDESELSFMFTALKKMLENNSFEAESQLQIILSHLSPEMRLRASHLASHISHLEFASATRELVSLAGSMNIDISI